MGILTDFFIASPAELASRNLQLLPHQENGLQTVEAKNIDPTALALWEEVLTGIRPPELDYQTSLAGIFNGGPDGAWVGIVRNELVAAIASASDDQLMDVAVAWAREERMEDEEVEIAQLFKELRALAIEARASRRQMYLWTSL